MKLFLALPVYGGYDPHFVSCLLQIVLAPPCSLVVRAHIGDSLVARARNCLAADFLATDCDRLLFLDTDLIFSVEQIARLIQHDEDIVAGLYPKKQRQLAWVCNTLPDQQPDARGLQRVKYAGTGCLLIKRGVFESMVEELDPLIGYDPDDGDARKGHLWDFFGVGPHTGPDGRTRYLSEDWMFCQRATDLGCTIWADTRVVLKHVGQMVYPLENPFDDLP